MNNWITNSVFYHIYPLGFCGAPLLNEYTEPVNRIEKVIEWIPHLKELNINAIYFGPVFESQKHGYDTSDYTKIDCRLGSNADFKRVCDELHKNEIKIVIDGVFNHVGRDFWAFKDVLQNRQNSRYCSWFCGLNFNGSNSYGDPFYYDNWGGCDNLVKLNLWNSEVSDHLISSVGGWIDEFGIDGLRLDAADCVDINFFHRLKDFTKSRKGDFWLMAEIIHGDYTRWANPDLLDSVTNYECSKGIWSSHNDKNYFEIAHSLNRQFGKGGIYRNICTYNFVDNHDVIRIASVLKNYNHIKNVFTLLYTMPGVPSIYYGSEWGIRGEKRDGDEALRPCLDLNYIPNADSELKNHIAELGKLRTTLDAFKGINYEQVIVRNEQLVYKRENSGQTVYVALNLSDVPYHFEFQSAYGSLSDLLTNAEVPVVNGNASFDIPAYSSMIITDKALCISEKHCQESSEISSPTEIKLGRYRHFKGNEYEVIGIAKHSETLEETVVYKALYGEGDIWVRPARMWLDPPDRFVFIGD